MQSTDQEVTDKLNEVYDNTDELGKEAINIAVAGKGAAAAGRELMILATEAAKTDGETVLAKKLEEVWILFDDAFDKLSDILAKS